MNTNTKHRLDLDTYKHGESYVAGLPGYPRNFSRDTLLAGIIAGDADLLNSQLIMSAKHQGVRHDAITGEEPGKIHHEFPGVVYREPYYTTYNACDTTALFLVAIYELETLDAPAAAVFRSQYDASIDKAITYILDHVDQSIFWEYPPEGAHQYSLRVTYWKDSVLPDERIEAAYPVAYALSQFQAAYGILCASKLRHDTDLAQLADRMYRKGIETFIREDGFVVLQDANGTLTQNSSDELHSLRYIPKTYAKYLPLTNIATRAESLFTEAGIVCTPEDIASKLPDTYHGYVVWPFEQALIHAGANRFGLNAAADVTTRCIPYIKNGQELLTIKPSIAPSGNDRQLWSVAASMYFSKQNINRKEPKTSKRSALIKQFQVAWQLQ